MYGREFLSFSLRSSLLRGEKQSFTEFSEILESTKSHEEARSFFEHGFYGLHGENP